MSHIWLCWPMPVRRMGWPVCCASGSESRSIAPAWRNAIRTFCPTILPPSNWRATWLAAVTRESSTIRMASVDASMNDCNCGWLVIAPGSIALFAGAGVAASGSCGSAAMNNATSMDTSATKTRSTLPANCPAISAPPIATAIANRIFGDSQLFTFTVRPFLAHRSLGFARDNVPHIDGPWTRKCNGWKSGDIVLGE